MAPLPAHTVKILERARVTPPPNSVTRTSLPLTFFDVGAVWLPIQPTQRVFFYELTHSKTYLIHTILPALKRTLCHSLQLFYPLAGNLSKCPESGTPEVRYTEGDSVELTIAESNSDFYQLIQNGPLDVALFHPLVPDLPVSGIPAPVMALQVTMFSGSGICIGISVHHAAADSRSWVHFMRSWASICRSGDGSTVAPLPFYDRTVIPKEMKRCLRAEEKVVDLRHEAEPRAGTVRATFVLSRANVEKLRKRVLARHGSNRGVPFVLTCAYFWVLLFKVKNRNGDRLVFAAECRTRMEPPIPETYFGNCVRPCFADVAWSELAGSDGVEVAAEAIEEAIRRLGNGGVLRSAGSWVSELKAMEPRRVVSVSGSPKSRVYDMDFGWGRPRKVEVISIERANAMSIAESRDEEGGMEVGLVLPRCEMDDFASLFADGLRSLS